MTKHLLQLTSNFPILTLRTTFQGRLQGQPHRQEGQRQEQPVVGRADGTPRTAPVRVQRCLRRLRQIIIYSPLLFALLQSAYPN